MTITVTVDSKPYIVLFSGTLEVSRSGPRYEDLVIHRASDDFRLWGVCLDAKKIDQDEELIERINQRMLIRWPLVSPVLGSTTPMTYGDWVSQYAERRIKDA